MRILKFRCLISLMLLGCILSAQEEINFDDYFFKNIYQSNSSSEVLEAHLFNTSWVDEIELRTETDEFELERQRFAVRVTPSSKKVNKAIRDLMHAYSNKSSLYNLDVVRNSIDMAYEVTMSAYSLALQSKYQSQLLIVLYDQNKVYETLIEAKKTYSVRWLDVQKEILNLELEIFENQKRYSFLIGEGVAINWNPMIDVAYIKKNLPFINMQSSAEYPAEYTIESNIIDQEIQLEEAEATNFLDFFQFDYRGPSNNALDEKLSLTAAFRIPMVDNKSKLKIAELKNEQLELAIKHSTEQAKRKSDLEEDYLELNLLLEVFDLRQEAILEMELKVEKVESAYQEYALSDPLIILRQNEIILNEKISLAKLESKIIDSYIDYLKLSEALYLMPLNNYLLKEAGSH